MSYAPIIIFVYNRADHFKQVYDALAACKEAKQSDLFIFSDGAKNEAGKEKEAKAYAALEDVEISESRTDDMIKISISKDIDISAPVMNKILGKTYTIKDEKTIYIGDENEQ